MTRPSPVRKNARPRPGKRAPKRYIRNPSYRANLVRANAKLARWRLPDFTGVTVIDGKRFWVNVYKKFDLNGNRYVSVNVRPWADTAAVLTHNDSRVSTAH